MSWRHMVLVGAAVVVATVAALLSDNPRAIAQTSARTPAPGEGVICAWAIYTVALEVGTRCHPGEDADVQAELQHSVSMVDAYVTANTNPHATQQQLDEFKRSQGHVGEPLASLCHGDPEQLYRSIVQQGAPAIRESVSGLVSRPGEPTWGTCL